MVKPYKWLKLSAWQHSGYGWQINCHRHNEESRSANCSWKWRTVACIIFLLKFTWKLEILVRLVLVPWHWLDGKNSCNRAQRRPLSLRMRLVSQWWSRYMIVFFICNFLTFVSYNLLTSSSLSGWQIIFSMLQDFGHKYVFHL